MEARGKRFICEICGKPHSTVIERAICELKCSERLEREREVTRREDERRCLQESFTSFIELVVNYKKIYNEEVYMHISKGDLQFRSVWNVNFKVNYTK